MTAAQKFFIAILGVLLLATQATGLCNGKRCLPHQCCLKKPGATVAVCESVPMAGGSCDEPYNRKCNILGMTLKYVDQDKEYAGESCPQCFMGLTCMSTGSQLPGNAICGYG